jgi:hypothetical protein
VIRRVPCSAAPGSRARVLTVSQEMGHGGQEHRDGQGEVQERADLAAAEQLAWVPQVTLRDQDTKGPRQERTDVSDLSVVCRARQLRYCDTGDVPPTVPGLRMAMLGELLGITTWQAGEPGQREPLAPDPTRADSFVR